MIESIKSGEMKQTGSGKLTELLKKISKRVLKFLFSSVR
ncbi:MAG: hypothetical protein CM1200mP28_10260 [Deltaproteobacteria bacterium]|nr:MAG: hypothetical protein CM1200mP28_10260 [Deltaproteobacteria bacterium]